MMPDSGYLDLYGVCVYVYVCLTLMPEMCFGAKVYALLCPKAIACKHNSFAWCQGICLAL